MSNWNYSLRIDKPKIFSKGQFSRYFANFWFTNENPPYSQREYSHLYFLYDLKCICRNVQWRNKRMLSFQKKKKKYKKLATLVFHHDNSKRKHSFFEGKIRIKDGIPMINYRQPLASYSAPPFILRKLLMKLLLCGLFFFFFSQSILNYGISYDLLGTEIRTSE